FPVASAGIRLSGSSEVALQIPEPGRFGYGFYNVEISKDLSSWTSALPNAVDVRDGDNLSETELDYDREAGDFWRVIFKSVSEE
ncbi:MAG: hypothetical protein P8L44_03950, partial [Opitutales bacterium]|nr:hypothetical protein [Opitutales bacterium]